MPSRYPQFDRSRLKILPLSQRRNLVALSDLLEVGDAPTPFEHPHLPPLADAVAAARRAGRAVILLMGADVIKRGLSRYVIDFIRRGWVSLVAMNGAGCVHDYELARIGATSESVAENIRQGHFGLWRETAEINDIVSAGSADGLGLGEALGRAVAAGCGPAGSDGLPHRDVSIFAAAYQAGVPATVHVGVGYDILHEHPNFEAAAAGAASYRDFLVFAREVENLEGGVVLCCGTAVMGPEVYPLDGPQRSRPRSANSPLHLGGLDLLHLSGDLHAEAPGDPPGTTIARTRRSWSARWPTAGPATTSGATTASPRCTSC